MAVARASEYHQLRDHPRSRRVRFDARSKCFKALVGRGVAKGAEQNLRGLTVVLKEMFAVAPTRFSGRGPVERETTEFRDIDKATGRVVVVSAEETTGPKPRGQASARPRARCKSSNFIQHGEDVDAEMEAFCRGRPMVDMDPCTGVLLQYIAAERINLACAQFPIWSDHRIGTAIDMLGVNAAGELVIFEFKSTLSGMARFDYRNYENATAKWDPPLEGIQASPLNSNRLQVIMTAVILEREYGIVVKRENCYLIRVGSENVLRYNFTNELWDARYAVWDAIAALMPRMPSTRPATLWDEPDGLDGLAGEPLIAAAAAPARKRPREDDQDEHRRADKRPRPIIPVADDDSGIDGVTLVRGAKAPGARRPRKRKVEPVVLKDYGRSLLHVLGDGASADAWGGLHSLEFARLGGMGALPMLAGIHPRRRDSDRALSEKVAHASRHMNPNANEMGVPHFVDPVSKITFRCPDETVAREVALMQQVLSPVGSRRPRLLLFARTPRGKTVLSVDGGLFVPGQRLVLHPTEPLVAGFAQTLGTAPPALDGDLEEVFWEGRRATGYVHFVLRQTLDPAE